MNNEFTTSELNDMECEYINDLIKSGRKDIIKLLSNEKLVEMIQSGYAEFWDYLYDKTKNSIHKVYHENVHEYYKTNMSEDIYSILKFGWTKAVLTYDKEKATAAFIAYSSYLMHQQYKMFVRKIKKDRVGRSVRHELLESVMPDTNSKTNINNKEKNCLVEVILEDKIDDFSQKENILLLKEALAALKEEKEDLYKLVTLHYLQGIPQTQIAKMQSHGQSYISRKIKQGIKFLQDYILIKSKGNLEDIKLNMLSAYNDN